MAKHLTSRTASNNNANRQNIALYVDVLRATRICAKQLTSHKECKTNLNNEQKLVKEKSSSSTTNCTPTKNREYIKRITLTTEQLILVFHIVIQQQIKTLLFTYHNRGRTKQRSLLEDS